MRGMLPEAVHTCWTSESGKILVAILKPPGTVARINSSIDLTSLSTAMLPIPLPMSVIAEERRAALFERREHGTDPLAAIEELDVQRINLREPDGTLRLVISNKSKAPGIFIKGKEYPHPDRKTAGMIFFNDEGTENGGLIFGGETSPDGIKHSSGQFGLLPPPDIGESGARARLAFRIIRRNALPLAWLGSGVPPGAAPVERCLPRLLPHQSVPYQHLATG
jgi:hypothetical protein